MSKATVIKTVLIMSMLLAVFLGAASAIKPLSPGIVVDVTPINDEVYPGETAIYNVSVESITNETEYVNFTIEPERSGWRYTFDPEGFYLDPGETNYSILNMTVSSSATPGDYYHNVTAWAWMDGIPFPVENSSYYGVKTTVVVPRVPTYAKVVPVNLPPKVQYKWEKPDDTPGDGYTHVYPIPGQNVTIDKYVVVCDPNGKDDISKVIVRTFYPLEDRSECGCEPCNKSYCCNPEVGECVLKEESVAEPLPNLSACEAAKWDAYYEGLINESELIEIDEYLNNGTGWVYVEHNTFNCSDPAGNYTVCAQVFDHAGNYNCLANTFKYLSVVALRLDFTKIDYGVITPSETKWVEGDDDMTTPCKPTVKNDGNAPMDIWIESWNMTSDDGIIPADKLGARINGAEQWLALPPGVLFDVDMPGCTPTSIDFSIHAPLETPPGNYSGFIRLTGQHGYPRPEGGLGVAVLPRFSTVQNGSSVNLSIKIVSTENFDDLFHVYLTNDSSLPPDWQTNLAWFNWTSTYVEIPSRGEAVAPLRADIPTGVSGYKAFRAMVESAKWTPKAFDTGIFSIS